MFGYRGGLRAVSSFVNRSAMFVEAVFKSTFGFSYVLFVTVVGMEHATKRLSQIWRGTDWHKKVPFWFPWLYRVSAGSVCH